METTERRNAANENIKPQADALNDLPVAGEQADETRGGTRVGTTISPVKTYHCPADPSNP